MDPLTPTVPILLMRDAHRMKEKFDLSLDNRQVVSLLIASVVVLGAVFVLGVVVGKKLASNQSTAHAPDLLAALDKKATEFTFQDELTKKASAEVPPKPTPAPALPASEPVAPSAPVAEARPQPAEEAPPEAAPRAPVRTAEKESPKESAIPTRTAETGGANAELRKALAKAVKEPVLPKESANGGKFTLQLAATPTKEEAQRFLTRVRDRGYAPFLVEASVPGRGTWYRVRMGSFPSREAAARYLADFRRETQMEAFITGN